ncbi:DUF1570 domain-containing protein [Tuwongella immobilis]|uniref:DUF1570 domain-containing protein n=1 Tax=Tuwongella immobilis TaxID=692036 RepID=A0A6C2YKQ5_9BACT|nr:DUF1570 domain-containing protein [Tuwongella immobilis]VIP01693.1 Uncharacterized protein OS=Planctomyces maris DSM 8797 GN=PM8797T_14856 PE=4 SV=1: Peptidase_MA_2 [Tuwongella immobilis]VTR99167.1 Uncharacterized protein OS=Planctomyces maris DSM 8797 GN=PM8797T_14856 PE=4 SV=1: Peptidase_MA_2 [Tuwongella immobilis]
MAGSFLHIRRWLLVPALATTMGCSVLRTSDGPRLDPPAMLPSTPEAPPAPLGVKPKKSPVTAPARDVYRFSQFVFYSDFELDRSSPLFAELEELRDQVFRELALPPSNTVVQVFLFEDFGKYRDYMQSRYPELPRRRAFFISQPRANGGADDLLVYTYWGDHIRQDLRHELTHALLHSVLREVPLWLDEGLAEYFELPPNFQHVNRNHLDDMRRDEFRPNLPRLEGLTQVDQMKQPEYREAWAWVHWMLRGSPEGRAELLTYLQQLRHVPGPGPLAPRLASVFANPGQALNQHLARLIVGQPMPATATTMGTGGNPPPLTPVGSVGQPVSNNARNR